MTYAVILTAFLILACAEAFFPARRSKQDQSRVALNFAAGFTNLLLGSILPVSAFLFARAAERSGWGVFNSMEAPPSAVFAATLVALSLSGYWTHRLFHEIPFLWRVHQLHHSDTAVDVSTSLLGHPVEAIISALVTMLVVFVLGPTPWIVIAVETIFFVVNLFHHANIRLPLVLSRHLERVLVTPAMHLIHHAPVRSLHDSNYGDLLSFWDRIFGTYRAGQIDVGWNPGLDDGLPGGPSGFLARLLLRKAPH